MNVLVYASEGASVCAVRQAKECLRRALSAKYSVTVITAKQILEEPWMSYTALLVMPGGADLPYCRALNGAGNARIKEYVRRGGRYLGICAGAYYACARIEFEKGTPLEVSGTRELGFYAGCGQGVVFKGFEYDTNNGARAARLHSPKLGCTTVYYNGGCLFTGDAQAEVVAHYEGPTEIEVEGEPPAAIVYKPVGSGRVVLSGVHFEYEMDRPIQNTDLHPDIVRDVAAQLESRTAFVKRLLSEYLDLEVSADDNPVPKLTPLHLCSAPGWRPSVVQYLNMVDSMIVDEPTSGGGSRRVLKDANDTFALLPYDSLLLEPHGDEKAVYYYTPEGQYPTVQQTPYFNFGVYFTELQRAAEKSGLVGKVLGALVMYGEVVTSTSTMLERNTKLLKLLPDGLVTVGTQQVSGRGRGNNVWVNPVGVLAVSGVVRLQQSECPHSLVFVQYLVSLALVEAANTFVPHGTDIGLRLKWPNDTYILKEGNVREKIGGNIVSCNLYTNEFVIVFGSGTNVSNEKPTTSLNSRLRELGIDVAVSPEKLLARYLATLDAMIRKFQVYGFAPFEELYYKYWLHSGARVILERYGNVSATIKGISPETGMMIAEDASGVRYELQPDGNSFDMLRGLIRRKL